MGLNKKSPLCNLLKGEPIKFKPNGVAEKCRQPS